MWRHWFKMIEYTACPYCSSKKVIRIDNGIRIIFKCGNEKECGCKIDSFPKEKDK
jgi:ribosomal protein L37AE/L43A